MSRENPILAWKGKTFNQVTSQIQKNKPTNMTSKHSYFIPPPLKIYRREIATAQSKPCNSRTSMSIDEIDRPNGSIVNSASTASTNGLVNTIDINLTQNTYERPRTCATCLSQVTNAKRRVRSSGNIKKQFDISKNNDAYYTSSNQYLVSRNRTFQQNQYNFIRQGNANVKPGDALSANNIYSANGINHCKKYYIASDVSFQYQWISAAYFTVDVSAGYYSVDDVNSIFKQKMTNNYHYYVNNANQSKVFLLNMAYNNNYNKIELQVLKADNTIFDTTDFSLPLDEFRNTITTWSRPTQTVVPGFKIVSNAFTNAVGFNVGNYPTIAIGAGTQILSNQTFLSNYTPGLLPLYVSVYYKPNNPRFANQGAVSASSLTSRMRYDTITNNTVLYRNAYGLSVANAMAYGVPANGYTIKEKIGYPLTSTPKFSKYTDVVIVC